MKGVASTPASARPRPVGRLARPLTSFVGRRAALAALRELLSAARLITLTGPGGSGKTRLALEVALSVQGDYSDGVWWVDLAVAAPGAAVLPFVAAAIDVRDQPERATLDVVIEFLAPRASLVVLDNCEHVIAEAAGISRHLLVSCPRLTVLITSRETLYLTGEAAWPVPPLELEAAAGEVLPEAVQLFVERAALVLPTFALTAQNRLSVEHICQALDGLPLAIELAAARVKLLAPQQIADHLRDRFTWLQSTDRMAQPRHRTLAALVAWSYNLLPPAEQALLQGLSIFASRFSRSSRYPWEIIHGH